MENIRALYDCRMIVARFWNCLDARDFDGLYALLAPEAVWVRGGKELRGLIDIRAAMAARSPTVVTRHVVSNVDAWLTDERTVDAISYVTVYNHNSGGAPDFPVPLRGPHLIMTVHDQLKRIEPGWRLVRKEAARTFEAP